MRITKNTKIYIACPGNVVTGGPETLHQLGSKLAKKKINVFMYYYHINPHQLEIPSKLKEYNVPFTFQIEDNVDNILIVPEVATFMFKNFSYISKVIWWLSLDFYLLKFPKYFTNDYCKRKYISGIKKYFLYFPILITFILKQRLKNKEQRAINIKELSNDKYYHLYNCQYVLDYLRKNGVKKCNTGYLCGPLSPEYFISRSECNKKNIVIYNPKKGYEFTEKIINKIKLEKQDITVIPIQNMSSQQIIELMKEAKVYMDFGFFPGPERIPREAVSCYCNLITSRLGSARNDEDILISHEYKFESNLENIDKIVKKIIGMVENYENEVTQFDLYREKVIKQVQLFDNNIEKIFKV